MRTVIAEFNSLGYTVYLLGHDGSVVDEYTAGNCKYDSAQWLPIGAEGAIDIATIEEYAEQTAKEIAEDNGAVYTGTYCVDDPEI